MRVFPDSVQFRTLWYLYQASRGTKQRIALKFLLWIAILIGIIKIEKCVLVDSFLGAIHEVSGIVRCPEIPAFTLVDLASLKLIGGKTWEEFVFENFMASILTFLVLSATGERKV